MNEGRRGDLAHGTIPRLLRNAARVHRDRPAIVDVDTVVSFERLEAEVDAVARALIASDVQRGDRVAIWAPNGWKWIAAALGAHSAGAALVPINTRFKGDEAAYVLAKSGASVLFTTAAFLGVDYVALLQGTGASLPHLTTTVLMDRPPRPSCLEWRSFLARGQSISRADAEAHALSVEPGDVCDVMFTSGTTGKPKGVMCSHAQTLRAFADWSDIVGLQQGDRYLVALPFFHSFGYKAGWLACLMTGATAYPLAVFDAGAVVDRVECDEITVLPGPPSLYQTILARTDLRARNLSSLRLAVTGAAAIPVELVGRMRDDLHFRTVLTGYGLTEATGVSTLCREGDDPQVIATTSGRAIPGVDVRVVDDEGVEVTRGSPGEVVVSGYTVMRGYFDDAAATAETLDAHGRLRTGDVGVMDEQGNLRITDRKKDMFIVGGFNVYPAEVESVLCSHEAIAQVAVVGAPHERLGEIGVAFVVPRPGARIDEEELAAWSRQRMANYKVPRRFVAVEALPTNATGKVLKHALRKLCLRSG